MHTRGRKEGTSRIGSRRAVVAIVVALSWIVLRGGIERPLVESFNIFNERHRLSLTFKTISHDLKCSALARVKASRNRTSRRAPSSPSSSSLSHWCCCGTPLRLPSPRPLPLTWPLPWPLLLLPRLSLSPLPWPLLRPSPLPPGVTARWLTATAYSDRTPRLFLSVCQKEG